MIRPRHLAVVALLFVIVLAYSALRQRPEGAGSSAIITDFHPGKARYVPGEVVDLSVDVDNPGEVDFSGPLQLEISHLGEVVHRDSRYVAVLPKEPVTETFLVSLPATDFTGYLATVAFPKRETVSTAIDVSSTALRFPRYGYVAQFSEASREAQVGGIRRLAQAFHINMFQFYDWFWRHEKLILREDGEIALTWPEIFGNLNSWPIILELVKTAHDYNSLALSYVMSYAAREGYAELWPISPAWGLFTSPSAENQLSIQFDFGSEPALFLFDPANEGWQAWIIDQYVEAIHVANFDGLHIDQFGPRYNVYSGAGLPIDLPNAFASFLDRVKARLLENNPLRSVCTFNIVDGEVEGWAVAEVATARNCDFIFSEIWFETNTYDELLFYIEHLRHKGGGRPVVLAGYPNYNEDIGPLHEAENAAVLEGVEVDSNHPGFTGTGFVDQFAEVGDSITWRIDGPEDLSNVTFVIRFANATNTTATRNVYVDDRLIGPLRFAARDSWSTWGTDAWVQTVVSPGPHTVRVAYDEDNTGAVNVDHLRLGEFDEDTVRLENAVMFASGATHIQLGDDLQSLAHEYYPNRSKSLTSSLRRALRRYYDFITAYENLLFDPELEMLEHADDNLTVTTVQALHESEEGRIFTIERRSADYHVLHLINLIGVDDELWRNAAPTPVFQQNVGIRYYPPDPERVEQVFLASPDFDAGMAAPLAFTSGENESGAYVEFVVPRLEYWDMIFMKRLPSRTAAP